MNLNLDQIIMIISAIITLLLMFYVIDWRYFRDWIVVFFFNCTIDFFGEVRL